MTCRGYTTTTISFPSSVAPLLTDGPTVYFAYPGGLVNLSCSGEAEPRANYSWERFGRPLTAPSMPPAPVPRPSSGRTSSRVQSIGKASLGRRYGHREDSARRKVTEWLSLCV